MNFHVGDVPQYALRSLFKLKTKQEKKSFYPRNSAQNQCLLESATSVINVTNRFHNALLVWNWIFSISKWRAECYTKISAPKTFFFVPEWMCCLTGFFFSPYKTFVFTVHRWRLRAVEVSSEIWRILDRSNGTESLGCIAVAEDFSCYFLCKEETFIRHKFGKLLSS